MIAGGAFFLLVKLLGGNNPLTKLFSTFGAETATFVANLALAGLCVLLALVLYAVCATFFPPRMVRVMTEEERQLYATYGIELDDLSSDYDDFKQYAPTAEVKPEFRPATPTSVERVLGGFIGTANVLAFVIAIMSVILLLIDCTSLKNYASALYEVKLGGRVVMDVCMRLVARFGMDFLFIGIVIGVSFKGKQKGLWNSLHYVIIRWVGFAAIIFAVYLPFSPYATSGLIGKVGGKCIDLMPAILGGTFGPIVGKLLAAMGFVLIMTIARWVLDKIFRLISKALRKNNSLSKVDGSISCIAYIAVGIIVCVMVWAGLYVIDYYNLVSTTQLFSENATISQGLFKAMETHLKPILDTVMGAIKGVLAKFGI
jgi:hypothetical protein